MAKTMRKKAKKRSSSKKRTARKAGTRRAGARKTAKRRSGRRTVMYSRGGKKLYAVRSREGKFKDIQRYSRAHAQDIKRRAKDEA